MTTGAGTTHERPPDAKAHRPATGGLPLSTEETPNHPLPTEETADRCAPTLGSLPVGARLILRCRADWRAATVAAREAATDRVVLNVASPKGGTYRVRRPADSPLAHDGHFPLLGEGQWRAGLARYDARW